MWIHVVAANNGIAITDATFSANFYSPHHDGTYWLYIGRGTEFWCEAPNYDMTFDNTDSWAYMGISLVYKGQPWPAGQNY